MAGKSIDAAGRGVDLICMIVLSEVGLFCLC